MAHLLAMAPIDEMKRFAQHLANEMDLAANMDIKEQK